MALFIGYKSMRMHLRAIDQAIKPSRALPSQRISTIPQPFQLDRFDMGDGPVDLIFPTADSRIRRKGINAHVWTPPSGTPSFFQIEADLYGSLPTACFLQSAENLDPVEAIKLGFELCGTYRLDPDGFHQAKALMRTTELTRYLQRCDRMRGVENARRASMLIRDGSASPMETAVAMMLGLPTSLGGFQLGMPLMNEPVKAPRETARSAGRHTYRCDLLWPQTGIAIEYDSNQFHASPMELSRDARRRNDLSLFGITVLSATWKQISSLQGVEELADQVARHQGKRIRHRRRNLDELRIRLWKSALSQRVD